MPPENDADPPLPQQPVTLRGLRSRDEVLYVFKGGAFGGAAGHAAAYGPPATEGKPSSPAAAARPAKVDPTRRA